MLRHHNRIARNAVYYNGIVGRHLRIVFNIVQSTIEIFAYTGIRSEYIAFAVEFEGDAVGMSMVAKTAIDGSHEVVLLVHTRTHGYPRHIGGIEHRTCITLYSRLRSIGIYRTLKEIHIRDERLVLMACGILKDVVDAALVEITRMGIAKACNHTVGERDIRLKS